MPVETSHWVYDALSDELMRGPAELMKPESKSPEGKVWSKRKSSVSVFKGRIAYGQGCVSGRARQSLSGEAGSGKYDELFSVQVRLEADANSSSSGTGVLDDPRIGYVSL